MSSADSTPDPLALAPKMHRLQRWLNPSELPATTVSHYADHPSIAVTVDPTSDARAASLNRNRVYLCGGQGFDDAEFVRIKALFEAHGVARFFVWLTPGPEIASARALLAMAGAARVAWTRYPTLVFSGPLPPRSGTYPEVRELDSNDINAVASELDGATMDGYIRSTRRPGFHHYVAFDAGRPIATAALACFENIGYLTYAHTAEPFRRRGAQSALIAARVEKARQLGCSLIVSQTLTLLKSSYANLLRAGFEEVYEQEVYECVAVTHAAATRFDP
jgi:GNAT superfamily N-acetyltransferase